MIFCGDMVLSSKYVEGVFAKNGSSFWKRPKIVNLESSINLDEYIKLTSGIALQSDKTIVDFFKDFNVRCVTLANNHFFDYKIDVDLQRKYLKEYDISAVGAGRNLSEAAKPYYYKEEDLLVVAFGWNVIRCSYASKDREGVNPYEYNWVESLLNRYRCEYETATIVAVFHWNYEFEQYPQPADREFAFHLVDLGVDAIIGHHAHIIQGYEMYKSKPIFYGLGNCYFPNGKYAGFNLNFPPVANKGMSVEINKNSCKVYITELSENKLLKVVDEGEPHNITHLVDLSEFHDLDLQSYISFFKRHRKKTKLLPIYKSFKTPLINEINDKIVICRQVPVDLISKVRGHR